MKAATQLCVLCVMIWGCMGQIESGARPPPIGPACYRTGRWSAWGCWSECRNGIRQRQRDCNNPTPQGWGAYCSGGRITQLKCSECAAGQDVVFVIDGSGSIGRSKFNNMVSQVSSLINSFDLATAISGVDGVRVGIQVFNSRQILKKHLNNFVVPSIRFPNGGTNIGGAIFYATNTMFTFANGDRPTNPNTLVLITDGKSSNAAAAAAAAKADGITIIAVGVGRNVKAAHLSSIVTNNATDMYNTNNFCQIGAFLRRRFNCTTLTSIRSPSKCASFTTVTASKGVQPSDDFGNF